MAHQTFHQVAGSIFFIIAVLHALRLAYGWEAVIGGWHVPMWFSGFGLLVAGFLAYAAFRQKS